MFKQIIKIFLLFLGGLILLSGLRFLVEQQHLKNQPRKPTVQFEDRQRRTIQIDSQDLQVEVVTKAESIMQGLSGREEIGSDGMLFIFPESSRPSFWMKEMKFDLDLIWIRNGQVVEITPNVPRPNPETPLNQLPTYKPQEPVDMVLEIKAGDAERHKILLGSTLRLSK